LRYFIVFILLLISTTSFAQILEGSIIDNENKTTISSVAVINKNKSTIVYSDSNGYYKILVSTGDSVLFSHTAYKPVIEQIPFSLGNQYKTILLDPKVYGLKQATITAKTKYQQDSIEKYETYEHVMNKTQPKVGIAAGPTALEMTGPVSYLADKISGNSKRAKKFKNDFKTDEQQEYIDTRYTPALVSSLTGIKDEDSLAHFMNSYPMEYQFARQASDLEMKVWIKDNYKQYLNKLKDDKRPTASNKE
jgi:hypothetical protein